MVPTCRPPSFRARWTRALQRRLRRPLQRVLGVLLAGLLAATPAWATWSIVAVNRRTGEIVVAGATCVNGINLRKILPVVVVGKGGGAVQHFPDGNAVNRQLIRQAFEQGGDAQDAFDLVLTQVNPDNFQYGIVATHGDPLTFSGLSCTWAFTGRSGVVGDVAYAIQGNSLAGNQVVLQAEQALIASEGDLVSRVMEAMQVARVWGGDGRCSCDPFDPASCGAPPPPFQYSSYVSFLVAARRGDTDGGCAPNPGCANGQYYLKRAYNGCCPAQDAVAGLQDLVDDWRTTWVGRPDHYLSEVTCTAQELPADGVSGCEVTVRLVDVDGTPLTTGGATLTVTPAHPGPDPIAVGAVTDHGDGSYSFPLTATTLPGRAMWELRVDDGQGEVLLWPPLGVEAVDPPDLHLDHWDASATAGAELTLTVNRPGDAGRDLLLLASAAGTLPGTSVGGLLVPLNADRWWHVSLGGGLQPPTFDGFQGTLDAAGRAVARMDLDPAWAWSLVGQELSFAALLADQGAGLEVLGPVGLRVLP